jgi:anti-sigma factor RsiW
MVDCRKLAESCLDFIEGALPDHERSHIQRHLACCRRCEAFVETYRRTPEVSRGALDVSMPERVRVALREFLRSRCTSPDPGGDGPGPR